MFDVLAIDWGSKRTGLALVSSATGLVVPYSKDVYTLDLEHVVDEIVKEKNIKKFIVGLPTNFKLQKTSITQNIEVFIVYLKKRYPNLKLETINENGSSKISVGVKNKHTINHLAACEIAKRWIQSHL